MPSTLLRWVFPAVPIFLQDEFFVLRRGARTKNESRTAIVFVEKDMPEESARQSILIVDDQPANIKVLNEILKREYDLFVALNGQDALAVSRNSAPDLILLDIMMPDMDGYEVCERLKADELTRDIPVVFVTAMDQEEDETRGLELGAVDYLTKPICPAIVKARVRNHLKLKNALATLALQNAELVEAARLREDVESITRHDLKSPLNGIIGMPRIVADEGVTDTQRRHLKMIEECGYKMLNMINLSLDLLKMERGKYELRPETIDLAAIVRRIIEELAILIEDQELDVQLIIDGVAAGGDEAFSATGDPLLCYSMLANLMKNAMEAAPLDSKLSVALEQGDQTRIVVHNMGAVPPEIRDVFFEKYTTSGKSKGSGLGAYSAKLIADTHGGAITMETSEEAGTTIAITLPK